MYVWITGYGLSFDVNDVVHIITNVYKCYIWENYIYIEYNTLSGLSYKLCLAWHIIDDNGN